MATLVPNSKSPAPLFSEKGDSPAVGSLDTVLRVTSPGQEDRWIPVQETAISIGGAPQCRLRISEPGVRPLHCLVRLTEDGLRVWRWAAETRLNGAEFTESAFELGDELTIGPARIQLTLQNLALTNGAIPAPEVHGFLDAPPSGADPISEGQPTDTEPTEPVLDFENRTLPETQGPVGPQTAGGLANSSTGATPAVRLGRITPVLPVPEYLLRPWSESPSAEASPQPAISAIRCVAGETVDPSENSFVGPISVETETAPECSSNELVGEQADTVGVEWFASRDGAIASLRRRVRVLVKALREERSRRAVAEADAGATQSELDGLQRQISALGEEVQALRADAERSSGEERALKEDTSRLASELDAARAELDENQSELARLRLELAAAQADTQKAIEAATLAAEQLSLLASATSGGATELHSEQTPVGSWDPPPVEASAEAVPGEVSPETLATAFEAPSCPSPTTDSTSSEWDWSVPAEPDRSTESAVEPQAHLESSSTADQASAASPAPLAETVRRFNPSTDWWTTPAPSAPAEATQTEGDAGTGIDPRPAPNAVEPRLGDPSLSATNDNSAWQAAPLEAALNEAGVASAAKESFDQPQNTGGPSEQGGTLETAEEVAAVDQEATTSGPSIDPFEQGAALALQVEVQEPAEDLARAEASHSNEIASLAGELPAEEPAPEVEQPGALDKLQAAIAALPAKPLFEPAPEPAESATDRPAAGPNTVSFIQRYAHLFSEEAGDAPAPAPMPAPRAAVEQTPEEEAEPSIDDYMSRLLQRSRAGDSGAAIKPVSAEPVSLQPVPPVEPVKPMTSLDELQRTLAPERSTDMSVLRELANSSARQAIGVATLERNEQARSLYLTLSGLGIGVGGLLMFMATSSQSFAMEGGGALVIIGALGAIYTARTMAPKKISPSDEGAKGA